MLYRYFALVFYQHVRDLLLTLFSDPLRVLGDTLWRLPVLVSRPETDTRQQKLWRAAPW